ncbi:TPA: pyr operon leader peptide [Escherichia coli]|nr:pyr operon leader peptide [Escherichia coli]
MVQCVRHFVLPRLKKDAGLPFFFPLITHSQPLQSRGFFLPRRQEIKDG